MRFLSLCIVLTMMLFSNSGCDLECGGRVCAPYPYSGFSMRYVNASGKDLFQGSSRKYTEADIKIFAIDENQSEVFGEISVDTLSIEDSTLIDVRMPYEQTRSFLEIQGNVTDTLDFIFQVNDNGCCGPTTSISEFRVNGTLITGQEPVTIYER